MGGPPEGIRDETALPEDPAEQLALDGLLRELSRRPAPGDDERFVARLMRRIRGPAEPARPRRLALAAGILAAAGLGALLVLRTRPSAPAPPPAGAGPGTTVTASERPLEMSLGSSCRLSLDRGAALRIEGGPAAEQVYLERGRLAVQVRPGLESFVVRTEIATVFVTGTTFEITVAEGDAKRVTVTVFEGNVLLTGPDGDQVVPAGQSACISYEPAPPRASRTGAIRPTRPVDPARSRLGVNFSIAADWVPEYPFVDLFRLSRKWISQKKGARWGEGPPLDLDPSGWVRRLEPEAWADTMLCTCGHAPKGRYTCLYDGEGVLEIHGTRGVVGAKPGRIEFESEGGPFRLRLRKTDPGNYLRNIRVLLPGFEKGSPAGLFHPGFAGQWEGFHVFRFMDWMQTNSSTVRSWTDRPLLSDATWMARGVPVEAMVDLCNRTGADPWFCMPHGADDDFVRRFASLAKSLLHPARRPYVEYSSDLTDLSSIKGRYAAAEGLRRGLARTPEEALWRQAVARSLEIFGIWEEVFGGKDRLVRVVTSPADPAEVRKRLDYLGAARRCDALAVNLFFRYFVTGREGTAERPDAATVKGWSVDELLDRVEEGPLARAIGVMPGLKEAAGAQGVRLIAAAGGQGLQAVEGAERDEELKQKLRAANRHPRMGTFYTRFLDAWKAAGGDLFCLYSSTGNWSHTGCWGLRQYADETEEDQPKLRAVMEWNRRNPRE